MADAEYSYYVEFDSANGTATPHRVSLMVDTLEQAQAVQASLLANVYNVDVVTVQRYQTRACRD